MIPVWNNNYSRTDRRPPALMHTRRAPARSGAHSQHISADTSDEIKNPRSGYQNGRPRQTRAATCAADIIVNFRDISRFAFICKSFALCRDNFIFFNLRKWPHWACVGLGLKKNHGSVPDAPHFIISLATPHKYFNSGTVKFDTVLFLDYTCYFQLCSIPFAKFWK